MVPSDELSVEERLTLQMKEEEALGGKVEALGSEAIVGGKRRASVGPIPNWANYLRP